MMEWSHDFCLACDRQTDGNAYCGEACRLADYEKANTSSTPSSPTSLQGRSSWPPSSHSTHHFFLPLAYDFSSAIKSRSNTSAYSARPQSSPTTLSRPVLTPSSSQSSLFSMQSSSSTSSETVTQLSDEARRELRGYASSFDQSRNQRRQSTQ